jgi:membrane-associated protein
MNIQTITQDILSIAGTFNIWLIISLFILCMINEAGLSIPYLMETIWILAGYHAISGAIPIYQVMLLWLTACSGRMLGAMILYRLLGLGSTWLMKIYRKFFGKFLDEKNTKDNSLAMRVMRRINLFSPFSVAFGRLIWLKIPMTILLTMRRQPKTLLLAIALSTAIWEGTYLVVGVIGGNTHLKPGWFVLYSIGALTLIYGVMFIVRKLFKLGKTVPAK